MTSKDIQRALFGRIGSQSQLMIPNYTPNHWFESDMIRVTNSGYMEEYEIKISVADFKIDCRKGPSERDKQFFLSFSPESSTYKNFDPRTKHERLASGDARGPCRFFFAMPEDMAAKVEIPEWAGLVTFRENQYGICMNRMDEETNTYKKPKQLHKGKVCEKMMDHARGVFYFRYWNLRNGMKEDSK